MEDRHRKYILKNLDSLVRLTSYKKLVNKCEQEALLSNVMRARIDNLLDADEREKHKQLFVKLTKRGPTAYAKLIKILIDLKFSQAALHLQAANHDDSQYISMHTINPLPTNESSKCQTTDGCATSKDKVDSKLSLEPHTKDIWLAKPFVVKKTKECLVYNGKVPVYSMKSKNRGVFLVVNIIDFYKSPKMKRHGAEVDEHSLIYLFKELGFTCFSYQNLTSDEFFNILDELRSSHYLEQAECFAMALMSHGEMADDFHDRVEFYDRSVVKVKKIEDFLANDVCISLRNKPKVFIFPFCRGQAPDEGVARLQADGAMYDSPKNMRIPTMSDVITCYASGKGFQALRDTKEGAWYIQEFCRVLAENAHDTDFEDMLKMISKNVGNLRSREGYMQTTAYYNQGFKKLYFNPGYYETDYETTELK